MLSLLHSCMPSLECIQIIDRIWSLDPHLLKINRSPDDGGDGDGICAPCSVVYRPAKHPFQARWMLKRAVNASWCWVQTTDQGGRRRHGIQGGSSRQQVLHRDEDDGSPKPLFPLRRRRTRRRHLGSFSDRSARFVWELDSFDLQVASLCRAGPAGAVTPRRMEYGPRRRDH